MKSIVLFILSVIFLSACSFTRSDRAPVVSGVPFNTSTQTINDTVAAKPKNTTTQNKTIDNNSSNTKDDSNDSGVVVSKLSDDDSVDASTAIINKDTKSPSLDINDDTQTDDSDDNVTKPAAAAAKVKTSAVTAAAPSRVDSNKVEAKPTTLEANADGWYSPVASGKIMAAFTAKAKGIDIKIEPNQAVYAANSGKIVYSSDGIKGYGNVIILQHPDSYISVYAYNSKNLVKVGAFVKAGQQIAMAGKKPGTEDNLLHFELRKSGKSINPQEVIKFFI